MPTYKVITKAGTWKNSRGEKSDLASRTFYVSAANEREARRKAASRMYGFNTGFQSIKKEPEIDR